VCCHAGYVNDTRTRQRDGLERVVLPLYYKKKNAFLFFLSPLVFAMVFAEFRSSPSQGLIGMYTLTYDILHASARAHRKSYLHDIVRARALHDSTSIA